MKILTYNIAGAKGRHRPAHLEQVVELIRRSAVDVVGLQEVLHYDGDRLAPEDALAEATGMHAVYLPAHHGRGFTLGNAVLCREPITQTVSHELPHAFPERRILLEVESTTQEGLPITVFCTHLIHMARAASRVRLVQATAVAGKMSICFRPHFLVGDLNAGPHSRELHPVRKICIRSDHLKGLSSWPSRRPMVLYDHVWPGPGWEVATIHVLKAHVSDHRPVLARLVWRGAPRYHIMPDEPAVVDEAVVSTAC